MALIDRCPHRFAPLSRGSLVGDHVRCGYHGLQFDGSGQCVALYFGGTPPTAARVRAFPVAERDTIVWLWAGDPALADESLIPRFPYLITGRYKHVNGYSRIEAHYELVTDNLMDLSHAEVLHPQFGGILHNGTFSVETKGVTVESRWWTPNTHPTEVIRLWWRENTGVVDHWLDIRWDPPACMFLEVGSTHPGQSRELGFSQPSVHILTPQSDTATHYFWNGGIPADHFQDLGDLHRIMADAFDMQDAPMLEAVQSRMNAQTLEDLQPILLREDAGAMRARRVLAGLIKAEAAARATSGEP